MVKHTRWIPWILIGMLLLFLAWLTPEDLVGDAGLGMIFPFPITEALTGQVVHAHEPAATAAGSVPDGGKATDRMGTASMPGWLEPRGLSVVELVGEVPEEYLQGTILSYGDGTGIVVYEAGSRVENTVVLTTTIYPRVYEPFWAPNNLLTAFNCLGQKPYYDHMGSVVPASMLRVWDSDGNEVTQDIGYMYITKLGTDQPIANSSAYARYPVDEYGPQQEFPVPLLPDGLAIPANGGCRIDIPGVDYYPLTGVFTFALDLPVRASVVGTQQATFQTYIGTGSMGIFEPLMSQLRSTYPSRHGRIPLSVPEGANYFLLKFPPMAGDPYADSRYPTRHNAGRISGGSYRLSGSRLSTDLIYSAALPLDPGWRDADQSPGAEFLPLLEHPNELAPPEYILPSEIEYDSCFTEGNCPSHILEQIHSAEMSLEIIYLSVGRTGAGGEWVSLKMAGPGWSPGGGGASGSSGSAQEPSNSASTAPAQDARGTAMTHRLYIPFAAIAIEEQPPTNCPCGWFDSSGRMLYYCLEP